MRRTLAIVATVLPALGLELSTQTFTLTISRMTGRIDAILAGADFGAAAGRFVAGLAPGAGVGRGSRRHTGIPLRVARDVGHRTPSMGF